MRWLSTLAGHRKEAGLALTLGLLAALIVILGASAPSIYALALLGAALGPAVLYVVGNPRLFFLVGTVFTAAFGLSINFMRQTHIGGAPSFAIDLVDFFLLPLLAFQIRDRIEGRMPAAQWSLADLLWWCLILLGGLTVLVGPFRTFAAYEVVRMVKCWVLFHVVASELVRERQFRWMLLALSAGVVVNVVVAMVQFALKRELGLQALGEPASDAVAGANYGVYLSAGSVYRVSGLMGHPNLLGAYLALLLPILLTALFTPLRTGARVLLAIATCGGGLALLLTLSRSAWLAFAVALAFVVLALVLRPEWTRRQPLLKGALFAALPVGALLAAPTILKRIGASDIGALDFRRQWVDIAYQMIGDKPLFGHGLNAFRLHILEYAPYGNARMTDLFGPIWPVVHNAWMLVWAEQGTLGFAFYVGLHAYLLVVAARNLRHRLSATVAMANLGALCGLLALMVDGFASFFVRVPAPSRVFWIVMAVIIAADRWNRRNAALRPPGSADQPVPNSRPA